MNFKIVLSYNCSTIDERMGWTWQILNNKNKVVMQSESAYYYSTARHAFNAAVKALKKF